MSRDRAAGGRFLGLPVRAELRGQVPYGAPQLPVPVRLNTNENPYPPPREVLESVVESLAEAAAHIQRYPDRDAVVLRERLAEYVRRTVAPGAAIDHTMVWAANGSNEVLAQVLQAFGGAGRTALGFEPTYSMHRLIARGTGTEYRSIDRTERFEIDADSAVAAIAEQRPDVVFVCSPNNPTGAATDLEVVERLYDAVANGPEGVLVIDEAYSEFSGRTSAIELLAGRRRLIVSRSMSKAFAFAGARIGYMVADAEVVEAVQLVRLPYHLSSLSQAAAVAALGHVGSVMGSVEKLKAQRNRIERFSEAAGLVAAPSDANFVLIGGFADSQATWRDLLDRGVLVRDVGLPGWLRITAGTEDETDALLAALSDILGTRTPIDTEPQ